MRDEDSLVLYTHSHLDNKIPSFGKIPIEEVVVPPKLTNALWENLLLPRACKDIDVFFGPNYTLPLLHHGKKVVVIHSVNEAEPGRHSLAYKLSYGMKYRLSCKVADRVIVNSQSTRERVIRCYGIPENKIDVVWLGAGESFRPSNDEQLKRNTKMRYLGEDRPYVLFVGKMSERRNVPLMMKAFGLARKIYDLPHILFLVGVNSQNLALKDMAREYGIEGSFVHFEDSFANHQEIVSIYNAAELFLLPSGTEGFSLTLAEAMACGAPVITSSGSSLGEVANNYALTLDTITAESVAEAIGSVLNDNHLRQELRKKSLQRAKSLRWDTCALATLEILRQVANG